MPTRTIILILSVCVLTSVGSGTVAFTQTGRTGTASGQDSRLFAPMTFSYHATDPYARTGRHFILAEGVITEETPEQFVNFFNGLDGGKPPVFFNSPGGNLSAGLRLGRAIRKSGLDTFVGGPYRSCYEKDQSGRESERKEDLPNFEAWEAYSDEDTCRGCTYSCDNPRLNVSKGVCFSACAYSFLGGVGREIGRSGVYGIHQFRSARGPASESGAQVTMTVLANYLDEMGVSRRLLDYASLTSSDDMETISPALASRLNVDNSAPPLTQWEIDVARSGKIFGYVVQRLPESDDELSFFVSKVGMNYVGTVYYHPKGSQYDREYLDEVFSGPGVTPPQLTGENFNTTLKVTEGWKAEKNGSYSISFLLDLPTLRRMASEKTFNFENNFPMVYRHVLNVCTFSSAKLDRIIAVLVKQR